MQTNHLFNFLLFFGMILGLHAQEFEVKGVVKDHLGGDIPFANVYLSRVTDSTLVNGSATDENGYFVISHVKPDLYFISASYVGSSSGFTPLDIQKDLEIGALVIKVESENLEEVVVVAEKPTVVREGGKVIFNVENTIVSDGSTWDILQKTPGVIMLDDNLQIKGQTPTIYLNDRKVHLSQAEIRQLLQGLSGDAIKSVEVMEHPPARYEAESGAILNIVTSKNILPGYKGSLSGSYTQSVYPKYNLGTSHFFRGEKTHFFINYTLSSRKLNHRTFTEINYFDPSNEVYSIWDTEFNSSTKILVHNASAIFDYDINESNVLNISTNLRYNPNAKIDRYLSGDITAPNGAIDSTITNYGIESNQDHNLGVDISYTHKFKKNDGSLRAILHFTDFYDRLDNDTESVYEDGAGNFLRNFGFASEAYQNINIYTGQLDLALPIGKTNFESGVKYSNIMSDSGTDFSDFIGVSSSFDSALADHFKYDEKVYAIYANLSAIGKKWGLTAGIRGEQTEVNGVSLSLNQTNTQNYFELFPKVYLKHTPFEDHTFSLSYSRNLTRPRYSDLNPYANFLNENDYFVGNPGLRPHFANRWNFSYIYQNDYTLEFYYDDYGRSIFDLSFHDNEKQVVSAISRNMLGEKSYGVGLQVNKYILPFWNFYTYTSYFYEDNSFIAEQSGNVPITLSVNAFYTLINNTFYIEKDRSLTAELSFLLWDKYVHGTNMARDYYNLSAGVRKKFWNGNASVSLKFNDILRTSNAFYKTDYLNQYLKYTVLNEKQYVRLSFRYNFGNSKLSDNDKDVDNSERDRL